MVPSPNDNLDRARPMLAADATRVQALVDAMAGSRQWRVPSAPLDFGDSIRWRPHLVRPASTRRPGLLYVILTDVLQPYLVQRMQAAHEAGWDVHLVVDVGSLHAVEFVRRLVGLDVTVHVDEDGAAPGAGEDLLRALGVRAVALPRSVASALAQSAWSRRADGDNNARGRRLEGLLAFQFGLTSGLRIIETNLRTATEEIDIVLQTGHNPDASWYESGVPFVLVESKNWTSSVGSKEVSAFLVKVEYKRNRCRLGILCAAGGFSPDAKDQGLRLSATPYTIAMMGPTEIGEWIGSTDPTEWLDRFVAREMLR